MSKCNAPGCTTTENTQVNGKTLTLFSFPTYDDSLVKQWEKNSKVAKQDQKSSVELKLCELHFDADSFVSEEKTALAPGAVPKVFEFKNKRRIEDDEKPDEKLEPPLKQRKSEEEDKKQQPAISPPQSPTIELRSEAVNDLQEKPEKEGTVENSPPNTTEQLQTNLTKNGPGSSVFTKQIDMGKKVYRLIIRIDKVVEKRDDKKDPQVIEKPQPEEEEEEEEAKPSKVSIINNGSVVKPCTKTGCKLIKSMLNSKPVFQCERCNKYYIVKENKKDENLSWTCYVCQEILSSADLLSIHLRKHFTCDMCQVQCSTQISYDKHLRLHVSTDPLLPYKCHKCSDTFEVKADLRQHCNESHLKNLKQDYPNSKKKSPNQILFRCEYCYAVFKMEKSYKSHVELHMGDGNFNCALCTKKFKTAKHLATHQARHLGGLKYKCRICTKEFSSLEAVETHMKTHPEILREEHKCNICNKIFKNESTLNVHMRGHLSRAHRCPKCHKAFINKTTLRIHFKTHGKETSIPIDDDSIGKKRHTCTLCPSTFDSRSKLYNHIMTHLEQMHGSEGGDVVFEGLDQLLQGEGDIIS